jgi:hypothetical protein
MARFPPHAGHSRVTSISSFRPLGNGIASIGRTHPVSLHSLHSGSGAASPNRRLKVITSSPDAMRLRLRL